jgi:general secretion pathway protein D
MRLNGTTILGLAGSFVLTEALGLRLSHASQPVAPAPRAQGSPQSPTTIELAGQVDLARLIDLAAKQLNIAIDYDAAALKQQTLTIRPTGAIDARTLWALTNRSLQQRSLTTVEIAEMPGLSVVKIEEASKLARIEEPTELAAASPDAAWTPLPGFRNILVRLKHVSPKDAAEAVKSVLSRGGGGEVRGAQTVIPVAGDPQLILLSDLSTRIDEALSVLRRIDTPDRETTIIEVPLSHLQPTQVATAVMQLSTKRDAAGGEKLQGEVIAAAGSQAVLVISPTRHVPVWKSLIAQTDSREPVLTVAYTPRAFAVRDVASLIQQIAGASTNGASPDDRFKTIIEEPTGTLLVTGTSSQHDRIGELMDRLDAVPGEARRPMRAFSVRNRPVIELLDVLNRLIAAGALSADTTSNSNALSGFSPAPLPTGSLNDNRNSVNVITPAPTSPLLPGPQSSLTPSPVRAAATTSQGSSLSLTADEATNAIIAIGDARMLEQLEALLRSLDVRQPQVVLEVILVTLSERDSLTLGLELQQLIRDGNTAITLSSLFGLSTVTGAGATRALNPGAASGFTGAVIRPGDFSAVVRALQSLGNGRTVSLPRVLVANNQRTQFDSLAQEPYGVSFTPGNSTSTNVTFGGTLDAGTRLSIKPQIGDGDNLLLDYSISVSSFGEQGSGNLPPSRQVTSVQSLATVPDAHTVVVGGLETSTQSQSTDQLPIVGDIPLIGELFKNRSNNRTRSRFFVMIRASILRGESFEALRNFSQDDILKSGVDPQWPTSSPLIIK